MISTDGSILLTIHWRPGDEVGLSGRCLPLHEGFIADRPAFRETTVPEEQMDRHAAIMPVMEVMTRMPVTVRPETTVDELLRLFDQHDFNAFPVIAADGTLRGIVSKLDVLRLLRPDEQFRLPEPKTIAATRVSTIMRPGTLTVEPQDPIVVTAELMVATGLHSLPVVQRGAGWPVLVGIVSRGDLLRGLHFELEQETPRARATTNARHG